MSHVGYNSWPKPAQAPWRWTGPEPGPAGQVLRLQLALPEESGVLLDAMHEQLLCWLLRRWEVAHVTRPRVAADCLLLACLP